METAQGFSTKGPIPLKPTLFSTFFLRNSDSSHRRRFAFGFVTPSPLGVTSCPDHLFFAFRYFFVPWGRACGGKRVKLACTVL
jgi:hypothetical protein